MAVCTGETAQPPRTTSATNTGVPQEQLQRCTPGASSLWPGKEQIPVPGAAARRRPRGAGPMAYQESHRVEAPHEAGGGGRAARGPPVSTALILLLLHAGGGAGPAQCPRRGGSGEAAGRAAGESLACCFVWRRILRESSFSGEDEEE